MSLFLVATAGSVITGHNHINIDPNYNDRVKREFEGNDDILSTYFEEALPDMLWPRNQFLGSLSDGDMTPSWPLYPGVMWEYPLWPSGCKPRKKFYGITRDSSGNPLPGCTVNLFRASDGLFIAQTVSDTIGYFEIYSQYDTAHFMVASKSGPSAVAGATINTLLGA